MCHPSPVPANSAQSAPTCEVDMATPLPQLVGSMTCGNCDEGDLHSVIEYVRKSKYLALPAEWQAVF